MTTLVHVGLGANLGERRRTCEQALEVLAAHPQVEHRRVSPFYETAPVGPVPQGPFVNAVVELATPLVPRALLELLLATEHRFGRERSVRWGPRTLDLDLLLHGDTVLDEPDLIVPHPELHRRAFVLVPLADLIPEQRHPVLQKTFAELRQALGDLGEVRLLP